MTVEGLEKVSSQSGGGTAAPQIRGSTLLVTGRLIAVGLNFAAQVSLARYLGTDDYGLFFYALSFVAFWQAFATLGFKRAISRFVPIYDEKGEIEKLFGTILLSGGVVIATGLTIIGTFYLAPGLFSHFLIQGDRAVVLLSILVFLVPVEGLDLLLVHLFAAFGEPRAIFFRKYVLGPGLKLLVVLLLISLGTSVKFLAWGYLLASVAGLTLYLWVLLGIFRRRGLFQSCRLRTLRIPVREVLSFTLPVLTSDLLTVVMNPVSVLLLGYFHDASEVARFRVVLPAARFNTLVMSSLGMLYTPAAARLFARKDTRGINSLYWNTAAWTAVLSFPIFAMTFCMASPLTTFLYGARYESSATILALLALGYYFNASLGFNGVTLKVLGKVRYTVAIDLLTLATNAAANMILIYRYGALGAALGTAGTMVFHNILKQAGLGLVSGLHVLDWKYVSFYLTIGGGVLALVAVQFFAPRNVYLGATFVLLTALFVLAAGRKKLDIGQTFPALLRIPVLRFFLA
ncbi:MAG: flippase [Acidobacteriota bacterium]